MWPTGGRRISFGPPALSESSDAIYGTSLLGSRRAGAHTGFTWEAALRGLFCGCPHEPQTQDCHRIAGRGVAAGGGTRRAAVPGRGLGQRSAGSARRLRRTRERHRHPSLAWRVQHRWHRDREDWRVASDSFLPHGSTQSLGGVAQPAARLDRCGSFVRRPEVNLVQGRTEADSQLGEGENWRRAARGVVPIPFQHRRSQRRYGSIPGAGNSHERRDHGAPRQRQHLQSHQRAGNRKRNFRGFSGDGRGSRRRARDSRWQRRRRLPRNPPST